MSVVEDVRKVVQDFIAPELRGITEQITDIRKDLSNQRDDQRAMEQRLLIAIEQGKDQQKTAETRVLHAIEQVKDELKTSENRTFHAIERSKAEILLVIENTELKMRLRQLQSSAETGQQQ